MPRTIRSAAVARFLAASAFVLLALSGCGGGGESARSGAGEVSAERGAGAAGSLAESSGSRSDLAQPTADEAGIPEDPAFGDFDRKVVKTANLGIRSEEVRRNAARAQQVAASFGGSVLSSQVYRGDDSVTAELELSVPAEEFETVLDELRGLGEEVTTDSVSGQDVTEEYVDLKSRERNLLAAEESLLRLYDRAEDVEDALSIQRELTGVRGEIELVQGRIKYLDQRTAYSRITLNIQPVKSPPPEPSWDPGGVVARAWDASLGVLQAIATAMISAVVFGWWLAPVLVGGFVWWRRRNRGSTPAATGPS